ncbi:MAG TPA: hypothetical protein VFO76_09965 [Candidatus Kapabacteria bacterium]|nr:hypothetical protein [Candidatus Kapabacteria bacterium]
MKTIQEIIDYLEQTPEDSWCVDVVKSESKNCLFGHLFDLGGGKLMDYFEARWATTFMIYPVNDGENPSYQQATPKQRCIAYLKDLRDQKTKSTMDWEEEMRREYETENSHHLK